MLPSALEILIIEDNLGDIELICEALSTPREHIHVAENGEEALHFLYRHGKYEKAPRPNLIFLDLNMPRKDGKEVLAHIKQDNMLCDIPVIIMTSSKAEQDIIMSYKLGANCYVIKPVDLDQFTQTIAAIEQFWVQVVRLPL
jgi:two-component system response regulator